MEESISNSEFSTSCTIHNNSPAPNNEAISTDDKAKALPKPTSIPKRRSTSTSRRVKSTSVKRSSASTSTSNQNKSKHGSFVYVRVRPLLASEQPEQSNSEGDDTEDTAGIDPNLVTTTSINKDKETNFFAATTGKLPIDGFHGILGTTESNQTVFQETFLPRLQTVMEGGTSSLFCYG